MFYYGEDTLTLEKAMRIARGKLSSGLSEGVCKRVNANRLAVEQMAMGTDSVYGINTGFGPLCDTRISPNETGQLQYNLLVSHATGVGNPIAPTLSKLMLIGKIQALCKGYSGVRLALVERLLLFIEKDLIPVVPEQGSVGASGDLAPLAHLCLPLIGLGEFWVKGKIQPAENVLAEHRLEPLALAAKEGLALINGTQFILAHALWGLDKMEYLLDLADVAGALSLEGVQGSQAPFQAILHELRPFKGNIHVAKRLRCLFDHSENMASHIHCGRVQDPYSIRCMPQVHGASRNAFEHLKGLVEIEANAVTDNPVVVNDSTALSGGNFHGQPLALALDYATLAAAELGNIADRRCYLLLDNKNGLPRFLTRKEGINSGMMIPQYVTAALVSENKTLCYPASADSIPTALGQEDHVSMGSISGRKFNQVLKNVANILAIELLHGAQAMHLRRPLQCSETMETYLAIIRKQIAPLENDRLLKTDIDQIIALVEQRAFQVDDTAIGLYKTS